MTPNQQEELLKKFNKWIYKKDTHCGLRDFEVNHTYYKCKDAFDFAITLQQEKIEKLEKELHNERISRVNSDAFYENIIAKKNKSLEQQKFNNAHNLSIDQQIADKIKELETQRDIALNDLAEEVKRVEILKSDLDWITKKVITVFESIDNLNELVTYEKSKEIRQRHDLGE